MSSPAPSDIRQLDQQAQGFIPPAADRRPSAFLSLAPSVSASYPRVQKSKQPKVEPFTTTALPEALGHDSSDADVSKRRASTTSSDGAKSPTGTRFLKLGPVYWGEHQEDNQTDWHEIAVE